MARRIDLSTTNEPVRKFIQQLGRFREPIELMLNGNVVARLIPPSELSDTERQRILQEGWEIVQRARKNTRGMPAAVIQHKVDKAVREVRARHGQRRD